MPMQFRDIFYIWGVDRHCHMFDIGDVWLILKYFWRNNYFFFETNESSYFKLTNSLTRNQ